MNYTYTICDADPATSSGTSWPSHEGLTIEADSDEEALELVRDVMRGEAAGLDPRDGYEVGDLLYGLVWIGGVGDEPVDTVTYSLTIGDLDGYKCNVRDWSSVASYVATYPDGDEEGACDVDVQVGAIAGVWYLRTTDDSDGPDEADDTAYETEAAAEDAAVALAAAKDEAEAGEHARAYVERRMAERAGEPSADGEWCVYWVTALDDEGPRERYATEEQAQAAAALAQAALIQHHPGSLLCGYEVRQLGADGEWHEIVTD